MRALRIPVSRVVLAAALLVGLAAGLSKPAHAERDKSWDWSDERHGARRHHGRHHFDEHPRYSRHHYYKHQRYSRHHYYEHQPYGRYHDDEHSRYSRFDRPRFHALPPPIRFQSYEEPAFHGSIVIRSAPERLVLAAPLPPPPRINLPHDHYGVTELGRVR